MKTSTLVSVALPLFLYFTCGYAEIVEYGGPPDALPHDDYVHVVDEAVSPVLFPASQKPSLHAVVAGAPAPIWFLGMQSGGRRAQPIAFDAAYAAGNIEPIGTPILIQVGTADSLLEIDRTLYEQLSSQGKDVRLEIYEHGYHDFVLGPQGQDRRDLPAGEILLHGALDALERTVASVKAGRL